VGVLLCSRTFGELWCGFETDVAEGLRLGTNATLLQVAAGVVAGWAQLHDAEGVRVVEQLDTRAYLRDVAALLGAFRVVHDPHAPFTPLADRRCPAW
jgi:homospermidine synthase